LSAAKPIAASGSPWAKARTVRAVPTTYLELSCTVGRKLELASIADGTLRRNFVFRPGLKQHHAHLFGVHESPADIPVFRSAIERNQPIAMRAVGLEPVADFLRPLAEYLRAFRAFDFYFVVDHENP
jgi:hypothetical protein